MSALRTNSLTHEGRTWFRREDSPWLLHTVSTELDRAIERFDPMASPHEGWAVIREELDELWEHVKANTGRSPEARIEAIQVAAMALRYALDLCDQSVIDAREGEA